MCSSSQDLAAYLPQKLVERQHTSFTDTCLGLGSEVNPSSFRVLPDMTREAYFAMGWPMALATKGTVRLARGLASMMYGMSSCGKKIRV